jgi:hypothetical protein
MSTRFLPYSRAEFTVHFAEVALLSCDSRPPAESEREDADGEAGGETERGCEGAVEACLLREEEDECGR